MCIASDRRLVVIRRQKCGQPVYRVFPGGGLEPTDRGPADALKRELAEELSGELLLGPVVYVVTRMLAGGQPQEEWFYLCRIVNWSAQGGTGVEWSKQRRSEYAVDVLPLDETVLRSSELKPPEVAEFLAQNLHRLDDLPNLRLDADAN